MTEQGSASLQCQRNITEQETLCGAEIVLKALLDQGVEYIFGYPGGAVLPIYDAIFKQDSIRHILVRHEQAAAHAAEGYARSTGKVGVVLVTSGPGATNAVTGLTDALMDSIPLVCLTGQVPSHLIGTDAFQEADTIGITRPCTKHNYLVKDVADLSQTVHEAFHVAKSGRPGPVVIDLPKDILQGNGHYIQPLTVSRPSYRPQYDSDPAMIEQAADLLINAQKPVIYGGGGLINAGLDTSQTLQEFVTESNFPCTLTLMGLGALPASDRHFIGMLGMHGSYEANLTMHDCDVMLNVGARFDDRVTGNLAYFAPYSKKIHIDIDPSSINKSVMVDCALIGDAGRTLKALLACIRAKGGFKHADALVKWWEQIDHWRARNGFGYEASDVVIKPQYALQRLAVLTKDLETYITTEVGQHQMWAAQFLPFERPNHWMTSGGLGTMGYGFPAAMGVQLAHPDALVVDVAGEASILMNIQELSSCIQYRLPVKIFILNNKYMGMIRQWQELLHGSRYSESYSEALPDFVKLADAYGALGIRVTDPSQLDEAIREMIETPKTVILDVAVDPKESCFPMIPSGFPHNKMLLGPDDSLDQPISSVGMSLV